MANEPNNIDIVRPRFQKYFDACYGGQDVPDKQYHEIKQTFYSAYLDLLGLLMFDLADKPEDIGALLLDQVHKEVIKTLETEILGGRETKL